MIHLTIEKAKVLQKIDVMVRKTMQMDMTWNWPCGVAYYGMCEAYAFTQNKAYLTALKKRIDQFIELGMPKWTINTCAMGHCLITLYEATSNEMYWVMALSKMDYLRHDALRFGNKVLQHTVPVNNDFPEQAWADTLFMAAFFLLRMGVKLEDKTVIKDALHQYDWHIEYLQDKVTDLWYHGYSNIEKDHMSGFYWARANAWAAYTMSQVNRILPEPYLYPQFMDAQGLLTEQLAALKGTQTDNGLWRTVLDDVQSYEELSASCGIAAAMLVSGNPLHTEYVQKAYDGILQNISDDGRLLNVSGGTAAMLDLDGYRSIFKKWAQGWGQGLGLAFLVETLRAVQLDDVPAKNVEAKEN